MSSPAPLLRPIEVHVPRQDVPGRVRDIEREIERMNVEADRLRDQAADLEDEADGIDDEIEEMKDEIARLTGGADDGFDVYGWPAPGEYGERLIDEVQRPAVPAPYGAPLIGAPA